MSFKRFIEEQRRLKDEAVITVNGIDTLIKDIPNGTFTLEQYNDSRSNSLGWQLIIPKLDNVALLYATQHYLNNCAPHDNISYDGALHNFVVPELMKRLAKKEGPNNESTPVENSNS